MSNKIADKISYWFTTKTGKHIPVLEGQSKEEALKSALNNNAKKNEDKKDSDIDKNSKVADELNEEAKYQAELKKGDRVTMDKDGNLIFKGKQIEELDTSKADEDNSLGKYTDKDGNLTEERKELHKQIIEDYFKNHKPYAPGQEKKALFTGGGGASGKGAFSKDIGKYWSSDDKPMVIDPDAIKETLCHADKQGLLDAELTAFYHEESSALAKQIYSTAIKHNYPLLYDGTSTNIRSTASRLKAAKDAGYKTEMNFIYADWPTVRQNALDRCKKTGRFVPPNSLLLAHQKSYDAVTNLYNRVDNFTLYDNSGRTMKLVAEGKGNGKLSVKNKALWDKFKGIPQQFMLSPEEQEKFEDDGERIRKGK